MAPLGGLTIVWNALLATLPAFGGVKLTARDAMATLVTLAGSMVLVTFGPREKSLSEEVHQSLRLSNDPQIQFSQWRFFVYFFSSLIVAVFLDYLSDSQTAGRETKRIACGAVGGIVGGLSNCFAKSAVSSPASVNIYAYGFVVCLAISCAVLQLVALNRALARFNAFRIIPIYQTTLLIAATFSGGLAFNEFEGFGVVRWMAFATGIFLAILGMAILSSSPSLASDSLAEKDLDDIS